MTANFTKLFRRTTAALLFSATLLAVFVGVIGGKTPTAPRSVSPIVASADDSTLKIYPEEEKLSDDNFAFLSGGAVLNTKNEDGTNKFNYMSFTLQLKNPEMRNQSHEKDKSTYTFSLYRHTTDGNDYPISKYKIVRQNGVILMLKKSVTEFDGSFEFAPFQSQGINAAVAVPETYEKAVTEFEKDGWELQYALAGHSSNKITEDLVWNDNTTDEIQYPHIRLVVKTPEGFDALGINYFVEFDYKVEDYQKTVKKKWWQYATLIGIWEKNGDYFQTTSGELYTSIRSPKGILQSMKNYGVLSQELKDTDLVNQAEEILGYVVKRNVTVSFLEQIGDTPFARRVEKSFEMYVSNNATDLNVLSPYAVMDGLNLPSLFVLGSSVENFKRDTNKPFYYTATYAEGVYIKAYTNGGQSVDPNSGTGDDYFLDLNLSFDEYYGRLVDDGIISAEMYSKTLNEIKKKFRTVEGYTAEELYGYFGYIVIPTSYSLMDVLGELFDTKTSIGGAVCIAFNWQAKMDVSGYTKLLKDYGYHWIIRTLSSVSAVTTPSGATVNHYVFYADNAASEDTFIGQNGAVDVGDDSPSFNKSLEQQTLELMQSTMDFLNNNTAAQTLTPWESRGFRVVFAIATVGAMVLGSVYVYVRFGRGGAGDVHVNIDSDGTSAKKSPAKKKTTKKK